MSVKPPAPGGSRRGTVLCGSQLLALISSLGLWVLCGLCEGYTAKGKNRQSIRHDPGCEYERTSIKKRPKEEISA